MQQYSKGANSSAKGAAARGFLAVSGRDAGIRKAAQGGGPGIPIAGEWRARFDRRVRCLEANAGFLSAVGGTRASILGQTPEEMGFPAEIVRLWRSAVELTLSSGREQVFEFDYPTGVCGTRRYLARVVTGEEVCGLGPSAVATVREFPDAAELQGELRRREAHLKLALRAGRMGLWEWDIPSGAVRWSEECFSFLGVKEANGDFQSFRDLVHPEDVEAVVQALDDALTHRRLFEAEFRASGAARRPVWVSHVGQAEYDAQGRPLRMVGMVRDITERRDAERELRERRRQLRALAAELSAAEHHERRRIAALLHDDLAQELALCRMRLGALRESLGRPGSEEVLDTVQEAIGASLRKCRSLTFQLSPPILRERGLAPALGWLTEQIQQQHGLPCRFEEDDSGRPLGEAVTAFLFAATRELLLNAVKHARAGQAVVRMRARNSNVRIEVEDDGVGFDPAAKPSGPGCSGFGLAHVRERARFLGGDLTFRTRPGLGTQAVLSLPLAAD